MLMESFAMLDRKDKYVWDVSVDGAIQTMDWTHHTNRSTVTYGPYKKFILIFD